MIRFTRGAAYAVASAAFAVAMTFSAPSQAQAADLASAPVPALVEAAAPAPAPAAAPIAPVATAPVTSAPVATLVTVEAAPAPQAAAPVAAVQTERSLDELVVAHAGDKTEDSEQDCLAKAVYFEARGESTEGQLAVAEVVMNRAASGRYPPSPCKVVTQKAQFSFIRKGRFPTPDFASAAWRKAVGVARIALARLADTIPSGVLWYHASYVRPSWGRRLNRTAQIGVHIFYS